jgi:3-deoxy-D-manno-octulosonate 8-phosphate phosphatase (KDO 8-P phosphatase)
MGDGRLFEMKKTTLSDLRIRGANIKLLLTDVDGVLTDNGVYYSEHGEELKRFSFRDGMGIERLRLAGVETGIITRENSLPVARRAEKLKIKELHQGIISKEAVLQEILTRNNLIFSQVAFIGDDINDSKIMEQVGLSGCPNDAMSFAKEVAHYTCSANGGHGAFREFAEFIITCKYKPQTNHTL